MCNRRVVLCSALPFLVSQMLHAVFLIRLTQCTVASLSASPNHFNPQAKPSKTMSYTNYFADALTAEAKADSRIIAIHAAMAGGTGLTRCAVLVNV